MLPKNIYKVYYIQQAPLNGIAFDQAISDNNNEKITLSELPFPLNEVSFRKEDSVKLP